MNRDDVAAAFLDGALGLVATDTVYGLAAALDSPEGIDALYAAKGRDRAQPCQVLIYSDDGLATALAPLEELICRAARALLPGPVTCILPDPALRFSAAAGGEPGSVGLRFPRMAPAVNLPIPLVATSANDPGEPDPARIADVAPHLRAAATVVIDRGELTPVPSAVVDLRPLAGGEPAILLRPGTDPAALGATLAANDVNLRSAQM